MHSRKYSMLGYAPFYFLFLGRLTKLPRLVLCSLFSSGKSWTCDFVAEATGSTTRLNWSNDSKTFGSCCLYPKAASLSQDTVICEWAFSPDKKVVCLTSSVPIRVLTGAVPQDFWHPRPRCQQTSSVEGLAPNSCRAVKEDIILTPQDAFLRKGLAKQFSISGLLAPSFPGGGKGERGGSGVVASEQVRQFLKVTPAFLQVHARLLCAQKATNLCLSTHSPV